MGANKSLNRKIKCKKRCHKREESLSLGDRIYLIFHVIVGAAVYLYVLDKYKYEYAKNTKDITSEAAFIWLGISGITYCIYELLKKIYKYLRSK